VHYSKQELLIVVLAQLLQGQKSVAVGNSSPIPAAAALLAQYHSGGEMRVSLLGSRLHNPFSDGGPELFDRAGQGRIDAFFLGGGQIDGEGNINLVGTGEYPKLDTRFPGSFGSPYLYMVVPRVILFREEHTKRTLVQKVDFVSAPGWSPHSVYRKGGPYALVTGLGVFGYLMDKHCFELRHLHPGVDIDQVMEATGFTFELNKNITQTKIPERQDVELIRTKIKTELNDTYPKFARHSLGIGSGT